MSLTSLALKFAAPLPDLLSFDRYLFIGPHPDDIEIGAGASAAKLAELGKEMCFLVCLDGRYGLENAPVGMNPEQLISVREKEAGRSAAMLGVNDLRFLRLSDGGAYTQEELMQGVGAVIGDFAPDVVFAPDPSVSSECHSDHLNVGEAARRMAFFAPYEGIMNNWNAKAADVKALAYYMTAKPNRYIGTRGYLQKQLDAVFKCHLSHFPPHSAEARSIALYLKLRSADNGIRSLKGQAESFRVLGRMHMHCLPEASK